MNTELSLVRTLGSLVGSVAPAVSADDFHAVLDDAGVAAFYPGFRQWFFAKVVPGLGTGERFGLAAAVGGRIAGVAIGKRTPLERKLCTLWIAPQTRGHNLATLLARQAFDHLGTNRPLFTVPEERLGEFRGLLHAWDFSRAVVYDGIYRAGRKEHVFNGSLGVDGH